MQYQIQTAPIWDAYKTNDGCPLCSIFKARESRLVSQYLAENVMDPDFRVAVNNRGFCPEHTRALFAGQNKLGLALQLETRSAALCELLKKSPTDKKSAAKLADTVNSHRGCVICDALKEPMDRYCMTVAEMYDNESDFPELFAAARHCVEHGVLLLYAAKYAGKKTAGYLYALTSGLRRDLGKAETALRAFADCFDFRSAGQKPDPETIPNAIDLLVGK